MIETFKKRQHFALQIFGENESFKKSPDPESNQGPCDLQSHALPTELSGVAAVDDARLFQTLGKQTQNMEKSKIMKTTPVGFEPTRAEPNGFLVHRLNHSATVSLTTKLC